MSEQFNFDDPLPTVEGPFPIGKKQYFLKEASGGAAAQFRNASVACRKFSEDGKVLSIVGIGDIETLLVSLCLFEANGDNAPKQHPVPIGEIKTWSTRIIRPLFERAKKISRLDEDLSEETIEKQISDLQELLDRKRTDAARQAEKN